MIEVDPQAIRTNASWADTEDLLDRITVFRAGLESVAIDIIEAELHRRGVRPDAIEAHAESRRERALLWPDGSCVRCCRCYRPAVVRVWAWHRLFGKLPLFPRRVALCVEHEPASPTDAAD